MGGVDWGLRRAESASGLGRDSGDGVEGLGRLSRMEEMLDRCRGGAGSESGGRSWVRVVLKDRVWIVRSLRLQLLQSVTGFVFVAMLTLRNLRTTTITANPFAILLSWFLVTFANKVGDRLSH